jgi:hypothetical protein
MRPPPPRMPSMLSCGSILHALSRLPRPKRRPTPFLTATLFRTQLYLTPPPPQPRRRRTNGRLWRERRRRRRGGTIRPTTNGPRQPPTTPRKRRMVGGERTPTNHERTPPLLRRLGQKSSRAEVLMFWKPFATLPARESDGKATRTLDLQRRRTNDRQPTKSEMHQRSTV